MKRIFLTLATLLTVLAVTCCSGTRLAQNTDATQQTTHEVQDAAAPKVFFTSDISPEGLSRFIRLSESNPSAELE